MKNYFKILALGAALTLSAACGGPAENRYLEGNGKNGLPAGYGAHLTSFYTPRGEFEKLFLEIGVIKAGDARIGLKTSSFFTFNPSIEAWDKDGVFPLDVVIPDPDIGFDLNHPLHPLTKRARLEALINQMIQNNQPEYYRR